jgi:hypothetical protein
LRPNESMHRSLQTIEVNRLSAARLDRAFIHRMIVGKSRLVVHISFGRSI